MKAKNCGYKNFKTPLAIRMPTKIVESVRQKKH
jgi:hypothetical protein